MKNSVCVMNAPRKTETDLPSRRAKAGGMSERAVRPLWVPVFFPEGTGLLNALCRRVARADAAVEERWPRGCGARDVDGYHKAVRRWLRLRGELERMLIERGAL